ncbi:MAG: ABC transporter substrate-binding protein, partial [Chloroflexi bacterium]|nr:ABC transporter substrate-binding protein [Chloroflexota bacterium]
MVSHKVAGVPVIFVLSLAVLASACGGGEKAAPTPVPTRAAPPTTAPAPTPTPVPQPTGKLTYAIASFATETTVPLLTTVSGAAIHAAPVYDWLVWLDAEGSPVPGIAASWEMASDGRSWTFQLRRNMKFHNDQAITAEDVKFSIEFLNNPKVVDPAALALRPNLDGVDIVSPEVARVRTKNPAPLLIYELTPLAVPGVILPKAYWDQVGGETGFATRPVGSGPWRLTQHDTGARFVYRVADSPHPYRTRPKYAELEIRLVPEESTRVAALKTEAAQLVDVSPDAAINLKKDGFPVLTVPVSTMGSYLLHETSTPLV